MHRISSLYCSQQPLRATFQHLLLLPNQQEVQPSVQADPQQTRRQQTTQLQALHMR